MTTALSTSVADIGPQIQALLVQAAKDFKTNNGSAVNELGGDLVDAIFATQVATYFPAIPALPADPSPEAIVARGDLELARTNMFAVVAQAENQHYATIHALKLSAATEVSKVATGVLAIVGGFALKTLATMPAVAKLG